MELIDLEFMSLLMSELFLLTNDETKILIKILNILMHAFILYYIITSFFKYSDTFIFFQYYCDLYNISIKNLIL